MPAVHNRAGPVVAPTGSGQAGGVVGDAVGGAVSGAVGGALVLARLAVAVSLAALGGGASHAPPGASPAPVSLAAPVAPVSYTAPVSGPVRVLRGFRPPPGPYAPGHRGVDLAVPASGVVRAAAAGVVDFAGDVAGRGVVVLRHHDGVRTEYEPVRPAVRAGALIVAGEPIGRVSGVHGTCPPDRCLHWGARRGGDYFDPLTLLRALGPVRLLPWSSGHASGPSVGIPP